MKRFERIKTGVFIFLFVLICLFLHDLWMTFGDTNSKELFFPKLFENSCFYQAFDRDIRDEKVISFTCHDEGWGGNHWHYEIIMFCNEKCVSLRDIFKHPMDIERKSVAEIETNFQHKKSRQYDDFSFFKKTLENEYYRKYQKPLAEAIISHVSYRFDWVWYDHNSKIGWYVNEGP